MSHDCLCFLQYQVMCPVTRVSMVGCRFPWHVSACTCCSVRSCDLWHECQWWGVAFLGMSLLVLAAVSGYVPCGTSVNGGVSLSLACLCLYLLQCQVMCPVARVSMVGCRFAWHVSACTCCSVRLCALWHECQWWGVAFLGMSLLVLAAVSGYVPCGTSVNGGVSLSLACICLYLLQCQVMCPVARVSMVGCRFPWHVSACTCCSVRLCALWHECQWWGVAFLGMSLLVLAAVSGYVPCDQSVNNRVSLSLACLCLYLLQCQVMCPVARVSMAGCRFPRHVSSCTCCSIGLCAM